MYIYIFWQCDINAAVDNWSLYHDVLCLVEVLLCWFDVCTISVVKCNLQWRRQIYKSGVDSDPRQVAMPPSLKVLCFGAGWVIWVYTLCTRDSTTSLWLSHGKSVPRSMGYEFCQPFACDIDQSQSRRYSCQLSWGIKNHNMPLTGIMALRPTMLTNLWCSGHISMILTILFELLYQSQEHPLIKVGWDWHVHPNSPNGDVPGDLFRALVWCSMMN